MFSETEHQCHTKTIYQFGFRCGQQSPQHCNNKGEARY